MISLAYIRKVAFVSLDPQMVGGGPVTLTDHWRPPAPPCLEPNSFARFIRIKQITKAGHRPL